MNEILLTFMLICDQAKPCQIARFDDEQIAVYVFPASEPHNAWCFTVHTGDIAGPVVNFIYHKEAKGVCYNLDDDN